MKNRRLRYLLISTLLDFLFLGSGFLFFTWIFPGTVRHIIPALWVPFLSLAGLWLVVSLISGKYVDPHRKTLTQLFSGILVSDLTMMVITLVFAMFAGVNKKTYAIALGTGFFAFALESIWVIWVYSRLKYIREKGKSAWLAPVLYPEMFDKAGEPSGTTETSGITLLPDGTDRLNPFGGTVKPESSMEGLLKENYLEVNHQVLEFIASAIPLHTVHQQRSQILATRTVFNLRIVKPGTQQLIINLYRLNDIRRINEFLIQINLNLLPGGWVVCCSQLLENRMKRFHKRFSFPVNRIFSMVDFVFNRMIPKLPFFKEIYFTFTRGEDRVLSRAEVLGRLSFCGFDLVDQAFIDGDFYIVAQKIRTYRTDSNPSYGPLVKMRRVGQGGRLIPIYKLRTMYPYSEYIQEYMYKNTNLDDSGKFRDDFRVTNWGRMVRRLWIDELPQLLSLYRGQLKLVGVRAISPHYFSLYPKDLQELRIRTKPGLIPPYYFDRPKTFEEILESERRYLEQYLRHPWRTDWQYFWKSFANIVFRGARSA